MGSRNGHSHAKSASSEPVAPRKEYESPRLRSFGALSRLTQGSGGMGQDGGGMMTMMSDRRLKQNIVKIATLSRNLNLYLFDYLPRLHDSWSSDRQLGVMADEAARVCPESVVRHADGYLRVDYRALAIKSTDVARAFGSVSDLPRP